MFVAHHLVALEKQFNKRLHHSKADMTAVKRLAKFGEMIPHIRKLGNDNFTQHIIIKKRHLCDYLLCADGE